ncbi:Ig-like domain-containing protein [Alcanivorax profundi]|uniref:Ig-like domain-containing protein n=1 Tax=Alcanivorax profundi TaxID=2338368 RepID=UPI0032B1E90D
MTNRSQLRLSMLVPAVAAAITGCGGDNQPFVPPKPGNALIYTYPVEGMVDVPTASKALMVFSSKVSETAVMANCAGTAEAPVGGFCVTGPDGPVETASHTNIANDGHTIEFSMKALKPGTTYQVWLHREVSPSAENLDNSKPVFSFTTRQGNPIKSQPPAVIAFNQDKPEAFLDDTDVAAQFPIVDISPVRLTFSEPLFDDSVILGDSVQFIKISEDNSEEAVDVDMLAERHYITLQPLQDMLPDTRYEIRLSGEIIDLNGEALAPTTYTFIPRASKVSPETANPPVAQTLQTFPDMETPGYPGRSKITGGPTNQFTLESTALGINVANSLPNGLEAFLADPQAFGGVVTPVLARKGQQLQLTGIDPAKLGGEVHTDLSTGLITGTFLSNVTGYLMPNIYRPAGFQPDDERAPLYVYMDFDLALQTENLQGNATLNQNLMHVRAIGVATIENRALTLEVFRTLELDVLGGATKVAADFNLQARSDPDIAIDFNNYDAPRVTGTYPANHKVGVETNDNILLSFNEPLSPMGLDDIQLLDMSHGGTAVAIMIKRSGTTLTVSPQARLHPASEYQLTLPDSISDIHAHNPRYLSEGSASDDALGGTNTLTFTTADYTISANAGEDVPPMILGLHPGIGCALVNTSVPGYAGRCKGGKSDDELYLDFQYEIGRVIEASFSQPMDTDTMVLGTISQDGSACENGPICLAVDLDGSWQSISAALVTSNLKLQIFPDADTFVAGEEYRLVVNGDSSPKLYSHNTLGHLPLNTTPMEGIGKTSTHNSEGGSNIVIDFTAVAPFDTVYATVYTRPYSDFNGSGGWDEGEPQPCTQWNSDGSPVEESCSNFATADVLDTHGLITDASLTEGRDKIFATGALPMAFKPKQPLDLGLPDLGMEPQSDGSWCMPEPDDLGEEHCLNVVGDTMIPVEVNHQLILGTGLTINADAGLNFGNLLGDLDFLNIFDDFIISIPLKLNTRSVVLRTRPERPDAQSDVLPLNGYIVNLEGEQKPYFIVRLPAWLDVPDLDLVAALQEAILGEGNDILSFAQLNDFVDQYGATHTAKSLPIVAYLYGPISFQDDGRITLKVSNLNNITATLGIELLPGLLGASAGSADLLLPAEKVSLQVMNLPSRARKLPENAQ